MSRLTNGYFNKLIYRYMIKGLSKDMKMYYRYLFLLEIHILYVFCTNDRYKHNYNHILKQILANLNVFNNDFKI